MDSKKLIGYVVGWHENQLEKLSGNGFTEARADVALNSEAFKKRSDAEIVMACEKLRTPHLNWDIFEVHV